MAGPPRTSDRLTAPRPAGRARPRNAVFSPQITLPGGAPMPSSTDKTALITKLWLQARHRPRHCSHPGRRRLGCCPPGSGRGQRQGRRPRRSANGTRRAGCSASVLLYHRRGVRGQRAPPAVPPSAPPVGGAREQDALTTSPIPFLEVSGEEWDRVFAVQTVPSAPSCYVAASPTSPPAWPSAASVASVFLSSVPAERRRGGRASVASPTRQPRPP